MKIDPVKKIKVQAKHDCEALVTELKYTRERYNKLRERYENQKTVQWIKLFFLVFFAVILALSVFGIIFK
jgi:hypothetical protein